MCSVSISRDWHSLRHSTNQKLMSDVILFIRSCWNLFFSVEPDHVDINWVVIPRTYFVFTIPLSFRFRRRSSYVGVERSAYLTRVSSSPRCTVRHFGRRSTRSIRPATTWSDERQRRSHRRTGLVGGEIRQRPSWRSETDLGTGVADSRSTPTMSVSIGTSRIRGSTCREKNHGTNKSREKIVINSI